MHKKVIVPPGGKTSISLGGDQNDSPPLKSPPGANKCQEERNKSHVFTVGSEGLGPHYNPYHGKRQQSSIQFGGAEKVEVKPGIKLQPNANQSHVFDGPEPTPQPKQVTPQPTVQTNKKAAPQKPAAPPVEQKAPVADKPAPQPAKKPADPPAKVMSKAVEEPKPREYVKTSVQVLAPPGGSSSIVFG